MTWNPSLQRDRASHAVTMASTEVQTGTVPVQFTMAKGAFLPPEVLKTIEMEVRKMSASAENSPVELKVIIEEQSKTVEVHSLKERSNSNESADTSSGQEKPTRPRRSVVKPQRFRNFVDSMCSQQKVEQETKLAGNNREKIEENSNKAVGRQRNPLKIVLKDSKENSTGNITAKKNASETNLPSSSGSCSQDATTDIDVSSRVRKRGRPRKDTTTSQKMDGVSLENSQLSRAGAPANSGHDESCTVEPLAKKIGRPERDNITKSSCLTKQDVFSPGKKRGRPRKSSPGAEDLASKNTSPVKGPGCELGGAPEQQKLQKSQQESSNGPESEAFKLDNEGSKGLETPRRKRGRPRSLRRGDGTQNPKVAKLEHSNGTIKVNEATVTETTGRMIVSNFTDHIEYTCLSLPDSDDDSITKMDKPQKFESYAVKQEATQDKDTSLRTGKGAVQCNLCYKVFDTPFERRKHQEQCSVPCERCGKMFERRYELDRHNKSKLGCGQVKRELMQKLGRTTHSCDICGVVLASRLALKRHLQEHEKRPAPDDLCCTLCRSQFRSRSGLEKHKAICSKLTCVYCKEHFKQPYLLQRHARKGVCRTLRKRQRENGCDICGKVLSDYRKLVEHKLGHQATEDFECDRCFRRFKSALRLSYHVSVSHLGSRSVLCTWCGVSFQNAEGLNYHMKTHTEATLREEYSQAVEQLRGQGFKSKLISTPTSNAYSCFICAATLTKIFDWFYHLQLHIKSEDDTSEVPQEIQALAKTVVSKHVEEFNKRTHPCTVCQRVFFKRSQLAHHLKKHELLGHDLTSSDVSQRPHLPPLYKCSKCPSKFRSEASLRVHNQYHTEVFDFKCEDCGQGFALRQKLSIHQYRAHGKQIKGTVVCPKCSMVFFSRAVYVKHMKIVHEKHRPFECSICKKCFGTKYALEVHSQVHTSQKPHACQVCHKSFADRSNLLSHSNRCHPEVNITFRNRTMIKTAGKLMKRQKAKQLQHSRRQRSDPIFDSLSNELEQQSANGTAHPCARQRNGICSNRKAGAIVKTQNATSSKVVSLPVIDFNDVGTQPSDEITTDGVTYLVNAEYPMVVASTEDVHTENSEGKVITIPQVEERNGLFPKQQTFPDTMEESEVLNALLVDDESGEVQENVYDDSAEFVEATYILQEIDEDPNNYVKQEGSTYVLNTSGKTESPCYTQVVEIPANNNQVEGSAHQDAGKNYETELPELQGSSEDPNTLEQVYQTVEQQVTETSGDENKTYIVLNMDHEYVNVAELETQVVEVILKDEGQDG